MPLSVDAMGGKFFVDDNLETPDSLMATYRYPKFLLTYESRTVNPMPMFGQGAGTSIHGTEGTLVLNRSGVWVTPNRDSKLQAASWEKDKAMGEMNVPHWRNFLSCIQSREKPTSDIETCVRSSAACILANVALRSKMRVDWDEKNWTVAQREAKPLLKSNYRKPWKLEV